VTNRNDVAPGGRIGRRWWIVGLAIAALIVIVFAPLASADPDGLERVAADHGFLGAALHALYSIIPDYTVPGIDGSLSTILAGLIGVAIVFGVMVALGRLLARKRT
jgi:cobalt/nickel transport system permease protein